MKGYKAFEKGMICRGKQYAENTVFEEEKAEICKSGMHFCKNPLDILDYYPLIDNNGNITEFAEVEALDDCKTDNNKKYCTKKLKIGSRIDFSALVQAGVNFILEKVPNEEKKNITTRKICDIIGSKSVHANINSSGDFVQIGSNGFSPAKCIKIIEIITNKDFILKYYDEFGKTVFLTKKEAEAKLKELNNE